MIIRVFRGQVRRGAEAEFYRIVREQRLPSFRAQHSMLEAHIGRRHEPDGDRFVVITVWPDYQTLVDWAGNPPDRPYRFHELADIVEHWQIEHFEEIVEADPTLDARSGA